MGKTAGQGTEIDPGDLLFLVHIMKTGGTTVRNEIIRILGPEAYRDLRPDPVESLERGLSLWHDQMRRRILRAQDNVRHALKDALGRPNQSYRHVRAAGGHVGLFSRPRPPHRRVRVLTLLRDPVDRFLSLYYYMTPKTPPAQPPKAHWKRLYLAGDVEEYVTLRLKNADTWRFNTQCRYFALSGDPDEACANVDRAVYLGAPTDRLPEFLTLLSRATGTDFNTKAFSNRHARRPRTDPLGSGLRSKLAAALDDDQRLYDHVAERFARQAANRAIL